MFVVFVSRSCPLSNPLRIGSPLLPIFLDHFFLPLNHHSKVDHWILVAICGQYLPIRLIHFNRIVVVALLDGQVPGKSQESPSDHPAWTGTRIVSSRVRTSLSSERKVIVDSVDVTVCILIHSPLRFPSANCQASYHRIFPIAFHDSSVQGASLAHKTSGHTPSMSSWLVIGGSVNQSSSPNKRIIVESCPSPSFLPSSILSSLLYPHPHPHPSWHGPPSVCPSIHRVRRNDQVTQR